MPPVEPTLRAPAASRTPSWRAIARLVVLLGPPIVFLVVQAISLHDFFFSPEGPEHRDWLAFYQASQRLRAGEKAYLPHPDHALPLLYPPPLLWVIAPLARLPLGWAYAACVGVQALSIALTLVLLRPALGATWRQVALVGGVLLGSLQLNVVLFLGQLSAALTAVWVAALAVLRRGGSPMLGGIVLSVLLVKPNLLLPALPLFLAAGAWRLLAGVALGGIGLFALTLPLGLERWAEWSVMLGIYNEVTREAMAIWKQVSLWTFWRAMIGNASAATIATLWAMLAVPLTAAGMLAWHRGWRVDHLKPRLLGTAVLLALLVNTHSFYYDTLLLLVPAAAYWIGNGTYASDQVHRAIGYVIAAVYVGSYLAVPGELYVAILSPLLLAWFVLETLDLIRGCAVP